MFISGDVPVGIVEELYYRLLDYGIEIEDFIVDGVNGHIEIITNNNLTDDDLDELLFNESVWAEAKNYVTDIIDEGMLDKARGYLQNERGSFVLGNAAIAATIAAGGGATSAAVYNHGGDLGTIGGTALLVVGVIVVGLLVKTMIQNGRDY